MILGQYPAALFPLLGSISGILAIVICYYIAVSLGHQPPFPHAYITKTASHYPEYIFFRIGTITGGVFLILSHFINYFWLKKISRESTFNIKKLFPKITIFFGTVGVLCLFVSTATIDTGIMDEKLHGKMAGGFFIATIVSCLYNTYVCLIVYCETEKKITKVSMFAKIAISLAILYQLYLGVNDGIYQSHERYMNSTLAVILEYTLAFSILGYLLTISYDVKKFKMIYREYEK